MLRDTKNKKTNKTNTDITRDQEDKRCAHQQQKGKKIISSFAGRLDGR